MLFYVFDEFFGDDFLVNWTTEFYFYIAVASYRLFQAIIVLIFILNTAAVCVNVWPSFVYSRAHSLKSLSYDIA